MCMCGSVQKYVGRGGLRETEQDRDKLRQSISECSVHNLQGRERCGNLGETVIGPVQVH